jgi:hypothetical protein
LHRAGEGAPYTGIKDEPIEPIVAMADQAVVDGSPDEMIERIGTHLAAAVREKFNAVLAAREKKDLSVEAGREFVESYVAYTHYLEGIHAAILAGGDHHHEAATKGTAERGERQEHDR